MVDYPKLDRVIDAVYEETRRAAELHPPMSSHHEAYAVIREEFEHEYWPLVCENPKKRNGQPIMDTQELADNIRRRNAAMREELIQTAAMCLRALHDLC